MNKINIMKILKIVIIFFLCLSVVKAEEKELNEIDFDKRVSVCFHPLSTAFSIFSSLHLKDQAIIFFYSTVEVPLSLSYSLIIKPSLWLTLNYGENVSEPNFFRLGSDIGYRYYMSKEGEGLYLQGQTGIFYISDDRPIWFDIMGYIGHSYKLNNGVKIFTDFGVGYSNIKYKDRVPFATENSNFIFDINFGLGIPIGKKK